MKPNLKSLDRNSEGIEPQDDADIGARAANPTLAEDLDADEAEFRAIRRDLPGVKGSSAIGIVSINVGKTPGKNEFFRTHPEFRPAVPMVDLEVGMDRHFFAVTANMVPALAGIGITVTTHTLYLTVTPAGAVKIIPVRHRRGRHGAERIRADERNRFNRRHHPMGAAVHGPGESRVQSVSRAR